jgi:hypothetical protein
MDDKAISGTNNTTVGGNVDKPRQTTPTPSGLSTPVRPVANDDAAQPDTREPMGLLVLPSSEKFVVSLITCDWTYHTAYVMAKFSTSFVDASSPAGSRLRHTTSYVRWTGAQIVGGLHVEPVDTTSPEVQRLLTVSAQRTLADTIVERGDDTDLFHISFLVQCRGDHDLLGQYFFADSEHGPFTAGIHNARDVLATSPYTRVHFFALAAADTTGIITSLNGEVERQRYDDPLLEWWDNQSVNPQLGMQMEIESRPQQRIPARFQFDSVIEYMTVNYYHRIHEYERVVQTMPINTNVRLVRFPGAGTRLYYAAIQMATGLTLRPDSIAKIAFRPTDTEDRTRWKVVVVRPLPFTSPLDYGAFIFRPRDGEGFIDLPQFADRHVVESETYRSTGAMR